MTNEADALSGRIIAIVNLSSGGANAASVERMEDILCAAGIRGAEVIGVGPRQVERAVDSAIARADVVIVLGGDGTIRAAADRCGRAGKPIIPLAGGTMNMLANALYGPGPWEARLAEILAAPEVREVSGAEAGGQRFFCAAIIGAASLWADAREALRHFQLAEAARRSMAALERSGEALEYRIGENLRGGARAVVVICPLISKSLPAEAPAMEAAAMQSAAAGDILRLAAHALFDDWRRDPAVSLARVRSVTVTGHARVPVILDGERARMGRTVSVNFVPVAFRALAPAASD